ncbi:apolipoprotein N-acyltransferase [Aliikangiella marina]|uniref:Apolipoprotein N-acyltransferase n=1 Tax=Aliikangiella marina TaxID=1712262 RepID=A0A545TC67_9GAMM|nr:apolipoprotein N-acyltransferase [Aliikangiella marina]TQV74812.1 apolipoprotein N-acyltransferase [Aliikangiella marina]
MTQADVAESGLQKLIANLLLSKWQLRLTMLLAGAIYPLAFAPFGFWPIAFFSFLPLLYVTVTPAVLSPFKCGFYWGVGAFGIGASWVYVSIHEFGFVPVFGAALMTLAFVLYLALFKGAFAYFVNLIWRKANHQLLLLSAPFCWVISEYMQSVVFGGFPWLLAGYSQIDSPLAALATWLGVYGVSWMVIALSAGISLLLSERSHAAKLALSVFAGVILVANVSLKEPTNATEPKSLKVALIQPNTPQAQKWDRKYFGDIVDSLFTTSADVWGADFVIWPEGAIPAYEHQVRDILADLTLINQRYQSNLILGIPEYQRDTEKSYVALMAIGEEPQNYRKQVLVPFGEYVPLQDLLRGLIKFLDLPMSGFTQGDAGQPPMVFEKVTMIPAICYEIVYPEIIHRLASNGPDGRQQLIVTVSNDAWFGDSFGPYQHMEMARMRALELGVPLIRSTNDGITGFVDLNGEIISSLPRYQRAHLVDEVSLENRDTIYRQIGFWGIVSMLLLSLFFILWSIRSKHDTK